MTKGRLAQVLLMAGLLGLSACHGGRHRAPPSENVIRIPIDMKMTTLDPHVINDVYSAMAAGLVYDSLYEFDFLKRPIEVIPSVAEALPVWSKDRKSFTVKLKKGIYFQDDPCFEGGKGREIVADDVVYALERIADEKTMSPDYGEYEDRLVGINDFHAGKAKTISGLKIIDRYTVQFLLTRPLPRFVFNLADIRSMGLVPKECVEKLGDEFRRHPVGSGPYHIVQADLSSRVVAVRNPGYHAMVYPRDGSEDAGRALPLPDKVVLEVMIEKQPQWLRFLAGDFEFMRIPADNVPTALPDGKLSPELASMGIRLFRAPRGDVVFELFNMEDPVWGKSKDLRHAFKLALDVPEIIKLQYAGQAIPAESLIDPTSYGYETSYKSKYSGRDLKTARELLVKAGYPDGKGLPAIYAPINDGTLARRLAEIIERQVGEAGIKIRAEPMTWPEFDSHGRQKNFTMMGFAYITGEPDIDDLTPNFLSKNAAPGNNWPSYRNPEVDKLVYEIETMENGPARMEKVRKLRGFLDDDMPWVPMAHRLGNFLSQPWVKNATYIDDMFTAQWVKYLHVEPAKK